MYTRLALVLALVWLITKWLRRNRRAAALAPSSERVAILGASTLDGLGAALLRRYIERGTRHITIVGRRREALEAVRDAALAAHPAHKPDISVYAADCTSANDTLGLRAHLETAYGGIDTLHIVFGVTSILPLLGVAGIDPLGVNADGAATTKLEADAAGLERIVSTVEHSANGNLTGTAVVLGALVPLLQATSARPAVAVTGSVAGLVYAPTRSIYCATKSAQHFLVNSVALECDRQAGTQVPGSSRRRSHVRFLIVAPGPIRNSFVAKYAVDSDSGPRDNRDKALDVNDVARATVDRVDSDEYGMLVMPRYAFLASLLSQFDATCVPANKSRHRVARFAPLVPLLIAEHMAIVSRDWSVDTHLFGGSVHSRRGSPSRSAAAGAPATSGSRIYHRRTTVRVATTSTADAAPRRARPRAQKTRKGQHRPRRSRGASEKALARRTAHGAAKRTCDSQTHGTERYRAGVGCRR